MASMPTSSLPENTWDGGLFGSWYTSPSGHTNWGLTHYPRTGEQALVPAGTEILFNAADKPEYMLGSSEGDVLVVEGKLIIDDPLSPNEANKMVVGKPQHMPQHCGVGDWASWSACSEQCDTGASSRNRTNVAPRYGGDLCPHAAETKECNTQPCACQVNGRTVQNFVQYTGVGKDFCNTCHCHNGQSVCTQKNCYVTDTHQVCESTKCIYGPRWLADGDDGAVQTIAQAEEQYGNDEGAWPAHEMSTIVLHYRTDANGKKFTCSHTTNGDALGEDIADEQCVCYCKDSGEAHIWHKAKRHADIIALGTTDAGCQCENNWVDDAGGVHTGCANAPLNVTGSHLAHERHAAWCKVQPGSCTIERSTPAGADWDTCTLHTQFKLKATVHIN